VPNCPSIGQFRGVSTEFVARQVEDQHIIEQKPNVGIGDVEAVGRRKPRRRDAERA
jgi:hypothetical protein